MSTRLQVVMNEAELERFRSIAEEEGITLSEWVRRKLRDAAEQADVGDPKRKLAALRRASRHEFPAPDIDQMLDEIGSNREDLP